MKIDFTKQKIPFTQIANAVLNDSRISLKAKGLYAYLYSKPDGWQFESNRIAKDSQDSRDSVRSALKELESVGYLERQKLSDGRMIYKVVFPPITEKPETENPSLDLPETEKANDGKSVRRKIRRISNKDIYINKENTISEPSSPKEIVEVIDLFEEINPNFQGWYGNTSQRSAISRLIKKVGFEKTIGAVNYLKDTAFRSDKYAPVITTPWELEKNFAKLVLYANKNKVKSRIII